MFIVLCYAQFAVHVTTIFLICIMHKQLQVLREVFVKKLHCVLIKSGAMYKNHVILHAHFTSSSVCALCGTSRLQMCTMIVKYCNILVALDLLNLRCMPYQIIMIIIIIMIRLGPRMFHYKPQSINNINFS